MEKLFNNPAEFPEGSEGGGGGRGPWHPKGGGPNEMPQFQYGISRVSHQALINEILTLTARVQGLETQMLVHRLGGSSLGRLGSHVHPPGIGPHEFPQFNELRTASSPQELEMEGSEGGEGGTGIFHPRPQEIHEFQISEVSKIYQVIAQVLERISALETKVLGAIEGISR